MHVQAHRLSWTLPSALSREVVIADGSSAVVAGGLMRGDISSDHVFRVTPARGSTQVLPPLAAPRHDSAGVLLGGQLLVVGGGGASELSSVESASRDERWQASAHLPGPRSDLAVVAVPDGFLVVGGYDGRRSDREVLRSRDGRRFTVAAQLRQGVRYPAVVRVGASVWVFGGEDQQQELRAVQRVDTATGSVTVDAQLPHALGHSAAALVGSRVLLMGGRTGPHRVTDQMWWFDPESKRFSRAGQLPYPVADAGLLTVGSTAYLLGGETPELTNNVTRVQLTR
jgi:N-acetylneuraminic acid mutarotase